MRFNQLSQYIDNHFLIMVFDCVHRKCVLQNLIEAITFTINTKYLTRGIQITLDMLIDNNSQTKVFFDVYYDPKRPFRGSKTAFFDVFMMNQK